MLYHNDQYICLLSGTDWSAARRLAAELNCTLGCDNLLNDPDNREYIREVGRQCHTHRYLMEEGIIVHWAVFELIPIPEEPTSFLGHKFT